MQLFLLLLLLTPTPSRAAPSMESNADAEVRQPIRWGAEASSEIKSTRDKKGRTDGYEWANEASAHWMAGKNWGPMAGLVWVREQHENLDYGMAQPVKKKKKKEAAAGPAPTPPRMVTRSYMEAYYGGAHTEFSLFGHQIQSDLLYARLGSEEDEKSNGYKGFVLADAKSSHSLSKRWKVKTRARYWEFLRTRSTTGTDTRQWKGEVNPGITFKPVTLGLQNRLTQKFKIGSDRYTVDTAPFVKVGKGSLDFTMRAIFTPFVSGDGQTFATNWAKLPVYSAELEFSL